MSKNLRVCQWAGVLFSTGLFCLTLAGCNGNDGAPGAAGPPGPGVASKTDATEMKIDITGVSINSAPVVNFTVTNQDNTSVVGLTTSDLRFTIAKLIPSINGSVPAWQNYINVASRQGLPYIRGNRENNGTLVDHQNGTYTYTFSTDIADTTQTCPAAPADCIDADGNVLDTSYSPSLIHRVALQTRGSLPLSVGVYTFVPNSGPVASGREIVADGQCNECHNQLEAHDERSNPQYCVMCHNPGSTAKATVGNVVDAPTTIDFKEMIHKIHNGHDLASVLDPNGDGTNPGGGEYAITGFGGLESFKDVHFPQDINNCDKCHNGSTTPQGDNWMAQPSKTACGSCHDDLYFGLLPDATKAYQTVSHITVSDAAGFPAPADPTDDMCIICHGAGQVADVAAVHAVPLNVAVTKFQFNIIEICGTAVASSPNCAANSAPTVRFSVSDPTGATDHGHGNLYDVAGATPADRDPEFGSGASLNVLNGWMSGNSYGSVAAIDYTNEDGTGNRPARANSVSALTNATEDAMNPGTYIINLPDATPIVATSGVIALEGHPLGESVVGSGTFDLRVPVQGQVAYYGIGGADAVVRRVAVDITSKCDKCHRKLSLHGNNRADNAQLCAICHNPRNTDVRNRPQDANGMPDGSGPDGKTEESIDLKRLIHGIHAAQRDDPNTPTVDGHGFREKGLVIYGYTPTSINDFGHIRFPGILNDCTTCHNNGTYELDGIWAAPLQNGILATTIRSITQPYNAGDPTTFRDAQLADQSNDVYRTPTAAVCSACHDGALAQAHMETIGGAVFEGDAAAIAASYETCSVCHGPGRIADLNFVHGIN